MERVGGGKEDKKVQKGARACVLSHREESLERKNLCVYSLRAVT